jgi:hypothetical protein
MAQDRKTTDKDRPLPNEGEGSRSGAKAYDEATERFARSGKVEEKAKEAERAIESEARKELEHAETVGKSHSKGEDPQLKR